MKRFVMTPEQIENDTSYYKIFNYTQIGIICLGIKLFEIFFNRRCNEYQTFMAFKSSSEFQCLLFEKLIKVSPSSMKERAESSQVTNFMQIDAHRLTFLMLSSPEVLTIPTNLIGYCYMLFKFFGVSFIFGIITLLLFMLVNVLFSRKFKKLQKKQMALKDKRMKKITETFNNIKILKLYAWEDEFKDKINESRENELSNLVERFNAQNLNSTIQWFAPVATSVVSIGAYQYFNETLKIEDIMTSLRIFNSIQGPIRMIPGLVNNFNEVAISMKRIQKYLFQDEINPGNVIKNDNYMNKNELSIRIVNGNYSWGIPPTSLAEIKMQDLKDRGITFDKPDKNKKFGKRENMSKERISNDYKKEEEFNDSDKTNDDFLISTDSEQNNEISNKIDDLDLEAGLGIDIPPVKEERVEREVKKEKKKINPLEPILKNINCEIKKGEFICIIGEVGSGKSSFLEAILNNMLPLQGSTKLYVNGSISYVSQIPWIRNATIKDNILFYQPYDEERYNKVIDLSQLRQDLNIFDAGDLTEIGEKGVNLSGGQKARISIARALYAEKDIYIFDDPISALDANVGMKVMKNCIIKHLSNKTRILVTHALQYVPFANRIFYLNKGELKWVGTYEEIKEQDFFKSFYEKMSRQNSSEGPMLEKKTSQERRDEFLRRESSEEIDKNMAKNRKTNLNTGKIKKITKEEIQEQGKVKLSVYKDFLLKIGGFCVILVMVVLMIIMDLSRSAQDLWLGYWTEHQEPSKNMFFFLIYSLFGIAGCAFIFCKLKIQSNSNIRASRTLHKEMVESIIRAPISTFHETVPISQILNRFSSDINSVDRGGMDIFSNILSSAISFVTCIGICGYYEPYSLLTIPPILFIGQKVSNFYRNS